MFSHLTNMVRCVALLRAAVIDRLHQLSPTEMWYLNKRLSAEAEHRPEFCVTDPFSVSVGEKQ